MANRRVSVQVDADVSPFVRGLTTAGATAKGFARELESADSRMANLVQSGLALAPALVPIGAAAVPAIAGLTTQLGFAVAAAGTAVLAFSGVGDALDALNKAQLEPTAANIEKAREAFDKLGPAGQDFVVFIDDLLPKLQTLQDAAQEGLLPGVEGGISTLLSRLPQVRDIIGEIAETSGDLFAEGATELAGPGWNEFFDYLENNARPILEDLGHTVGNFIDGIAQMWMAFDPLSQDFSDSLLELSRNFADWSSTLADSQGFQNFIAYVRDAGPQVGETLTAIAGAVAELVEAAAPVGQVVLPVLEIMADTFAAIADSPIGPMLVTAAAGVGALGRSMALLKSVGLMGGDSLIGRVFGTGTIGEARKSVTSLKVAQDELARSAVRARDAQFAMVPTSQKRAALAEYAAASRKVADAEKERSRSMRSMAGSAGKAAAVVGGLAVVTSGLAEDVGLSNTASLALMGTIAGPWGAAIGGGVGVVMDMAAANNDMTDAIDAASDSLRSQPEAFAANAEAIANAQQKLLEFRQESFNLGQIKNSWEGIFGASDIEEAQGRISDLIQQQQTLKAAARELATALGEDMSFGDRAAGADELAQALARATPALEAYGTSLEEVAELNTKRFTGGPEAARAQAEWVRLTDFVRNYIRESDSLPGRTHDVADAFAGLSSQLASTEDKANALATALDALLGPELNQAEAADAWQQALNDLNDDLAEHSRKLRGNSDAALQNRGAIRDRVEALAETIKADAKAGVGAQKLADKLRTQKRALLEQADAAGLSRKQTKALLEQYGLTPELIETVFRTLGIDKAQREAMTLRDKYNDLPKDVRTELKALGADVSVGDVKRLQEQYDLTPKQVETILEAIDRAGGTIDFVKARLADLDGNRADVYLYTHETTIRKVTTQLNRAGGAYAGGGSVTGPGTATSDSIPAYLSNGEYVVRAAAVEKYGVAMFDRLNAMHFAEGGSVQRFADGGLTDRESRSIVHDFNLSGDLGVRGVRQELREFRRALREAGGEVGGNFDRLSDRLDDVTRRYKDTADALDDEREERRELRQDLRSYRSTVAGTVTSEVFGNGLGSAFSMLSADITRADDVEHALKRARKLGLNGPAFKALAASGDLTAMQQLDSRSEVRHLERLYAQRAQSTRSLAAFAGAEVFGPAMRQNAHEIKHLRHTIDRLNDRIDGMEAAVERGSHVGTHKGAAEGIGKRDRREHAAARHRRQDA